jgi:hypothetical protein
MMKKVTANEAGEVEKVEAASIADMFNCSDVREYDQSVDMNIFNNVLGDIAHQHIRKLNGCRVLRMSKRRRKIASADIMKRLATARTAKMMMIALGGFAMQRSAGTYKYSPFF